MVNFEWSWTEDGWMGELGAGGERSNRCILGRHCIIPPPPPPTLLQPALHQLHSNLASATPSSSALASCTLCFGLQCPTTTHSSGPLCLGLCCRCCLIEAAQLFAPSPPPLPHPSTTPPLPLLTQLDVLFPNALCAEATFVRMMHCHNRCTFAATRN